PVPSRRLGLSLGVDLVPHKTCTLNCVYCECGETTHLTTTRKEYVPVEDVIAELEHYLTSKPNLDYITFSGSGEPTLNSGLGIVIDYIKDNYPEYRVCLLTNGTLFTNAALRKEVLRTNLIIPSLDAASSDVFNRINRPYHGLDCNEIIDGLVLLRSEYKGVIIIEVLIVPGINDTGEELKIIKKALEKIKPDLVQIGTMDRPGTEKWVEAAPKERLREVADYLGNAELIGAFKPDHKVSSIKGLESNRILNTLRRRPCTVSDLQQALNLRPAEIQKYLNLLQSKGLVETEKRERGTFFKAKVDT
ncbi:MAG: radical SAM protein, partial [Bacillota bacterium]